MKAKKVLILGASYGSLLGMKLALAGHDVKLVCLPQEAALINAKGAIVRMPVKGREGLVEVRTSGIYPRFTQFAAVRGSLYPVRSTLLGTLSTNPQRSSQQQG